MMLKPKESIQFAESPRSPFRRSRSHRSLSLKDEPVVINRKSMGSLSAVNNHMSEEGLLRIAPIQPLVSETAIVPVTPEAIRRIKRKVKETDNTKDSQESALIELAKFPGYFSNRATPLPHGLNTLEHMMLVTKAQSDLQKQPTFIIHWNELFYSKYSQDILLDVFWWFFLHYYQPDQETQNLLFSRISENYVLLLTTTALYRHHDPFFKMYPDVLAQSVYSAFIHCFPTSWNSFDEKFRNELCDIVSLWFKGIKSIPEKWKEWNLSELEPKNLMKHVSDDKTTVSSLKGFDVLQLIEEAKQKEKMVKDDVEKSKNGRRKSLHAAAAPVKPTSRPMPAKLPIRGPEFEHSVVDIHSNSPLVIHFLQTQGLLQSIGYSLLLQHASICKLPQKDSPTFYKIIKESSRQDKAMCQDFYRNYSIVKQHMNKHSKERHENNLQHERHVRLLLSNPREIRQLSNNLVFYMLGNQPIKLKREKTTRVIQETIQRL